MRTALLGKSTRHLKSAGFTIVELLIVISLIIIITGTIVPGFNSYIDNQNLKQAQEQVKDDLRSVQNKALNGELATTILDTQKVNYWGIEFTNGASTYTTFISVDTSVCGASTTRQDRSLSTTLPGNYVIRSADRCIFFSYANGDVFYAPTGGTPEAVIVGPSSGSNGCRRIEVQPNGLIQVINNDTCS